MIPYGPGADDRRGGQKKGPAKLSKVKTQANKTGKGIKSPKGLMPGDNTKNKGRK